MKPPDELLRIAEHGTESEYDNEFWSNRETVVWLIRSLIEIRRVAEATLRDIADSRHQPADWYVWRASSALAAITRLRPGMVDGIQHSLDCTHLHAPAFSVKRRPCDCGASDGKVVTP